MQQNEKLLQDFKAVPLWDSKFIDGLRPIIIAGPCSAENPEQLLHTAEALKNEGIKIFRAGVWKPRTFPNTFEGVGIKALSWLQEVRDKTGMLIGCEVGSSTQAELALQHHMDYIWIGARTTSSPFAISEIASVLQGSNIGILIKNPLSPSFDLWKGAILRFINAGLHRIALLHRGFDLGKKEELRNPPLWDDVMDFRTSMPGIPFYFDPSHIAGTRKFLHPLIDKALRLHYDGFMIESHCRPQSAWSDAKQQVRPEEIMPLLTNPAPTEKIIELYRKELDRLDEELVKLLAKRRGISRDIGKVKVKHGYSPFQPDRYKKTKGIYHELSMKYDVPAELSQTLFEEIHKDSTRIQEELKHGNK